MRLSIRSKLLFAIALPVLAIYGLAGALEYRAQKREAIDAQRELGEALARIYAARFDAVFRQAAQAADSAAAFLTLHPRLDAAQLDALIDANIAQHPLIYGSCIAFEPGAFDAGVELFAPYGHRDGDVVHHLDIGRDAYDYRAWEWYAAVRDGDGSGRWTEPYFDEGAGNVLMCTYSAPFHDARGAFRGVATIDIPLLPLQHHVFPREMTGGQFVIVSRGGRFISHPRAEMVMTTVADSAAASGLPELRDVQQHAMRGESGFVRLSAFPLDEPAWLYYTPIVSTGGSFGMVFPESRVLRPVYDSLARQVGFMLLGMGVMLAALIAVGFWITRPFKPLAAAVEALSHGRLDTKVEGVHSRDELGDLARAFNLMTDQLNAHVAALAAETAAREKVEGELRLARQIQQSLLPRTFPPFPSRCEFDLHAINQPARQVAGDFYDYFFVDDHRLVLILADVSGKGVPAALLMAVTRTLLRNQMLNDPSPRAAMVNVNRILHQDNDRGMFVTVFCGVYDVRDGSLIYANAGHPPPVILGPDGACAAIDEQSTGMVLGVDETQDWTQREHTLAVGQALVVFTDGLTEARSPDNRMLGDAAAHELLAAQAHLSPNALCEAISQRLHDYQRGNPIDDLTLLVLRRNG